MEPESHPPTLGMLAVRGMSTCRKCRVHGVHSPMAGHRVPGGCAFETCDCRGCNQVALLRTQRRLYQKQSSLKLKARGRAAPNCASTPPSSAHDAATAEAQLQHHADLTLVPVLTLSDGSDDDDQVRGGGGGGAVGAPCIQFQVTERTPLGVNRCRLCRWHKVPPHSVGKRCPYASCKCGGPRCKARARLDETRRRWSLAKRGLQNDLDANPTSQEGLHTPDASGTQPGAEERGGSVSVLVRTLPESPPNLLPRLSVLNIEQCAVRIQSVTVSPTVAETEAPRSDATRTYRPTSCVTVVADETSGEVVAGTSAVETTSGEKTGVKETSVQETAVEETTVQETAVEETAAEETAVEDNATQEPVIGVSALDEAMHKLCIECSAPLASEMELQDHVDTVHMQLLPLWRLTQLFARMREAAWPSAEGTEMTAGEASAKCV